MMVSQRSTIGLIILSLCLGVFANANGNANVAENDVMESLLKDPYLFDAEPEEMCTTFAISSSAMADGSVVTSHTNDCLQCDFRLALVPAANHEEGSRRAIYTMRGEYPHFIGYDRGPDYYPENTDTSAFAWKPNVPIGHIPQVKHTYQYYDAIYGVMNEKQVSIGESTCSGYFISKPVHAGGKALFDVGELTRLAMERTSSAREAVLLMGAMAEKYGYYQCDWMSDNHTQQMVGGEALTVADGSEAFMFHILPDDTGASAIWAAQRVEEGHVSVCANDFVIKEIDPALRGSVFLYSDNMHDIALRHGIWKPSSSKPLLNFQSVFSVPRSQPLYVTRRAWRAFNQVAPSLKLSSDLDMYQLPFSVKVDTPLSIQQVQDLHRDHFEGSLFDLTKGMQAGPFGNPNRYDGSTLFGVTQPQINAGRFERPASLHRTSHTSVTQSRKFLPDIVGGVLWWSQYQPAVSLFTPLWPAQTSLSKSLTTGSMYKLDKNVAWWAYCAVGNYAERSYMYILEDIHANQRKWESKIARQVSTIDEDVRGILRAHGSDSLSSTTKLHKRLAKDLTSYANDLIEEVTEDWWKLFETVITKYHDGYRMDDLHSETLKPGKLFYPMWWLQRVGYFPPGYVIPGVTTTTTAATNVIVNENGLPPTTSTHVVTNGIELGGLPILSTSDSSSSLPSTVASSQSVGAAASSAVESSFQGVLLIGLIGSVAGYIIAMKTQTRNVNYDVIA